MSTTTEKPAENYSDPIVNCHTHVFTGDHVPPLLAKKFLPWPLYFLMNLRWVVGLFRWWYNGPDKWRFRKWNRAFRLFLYKTKMVIARSYILSVLYWIVVPLLALHTFYLIIGWISPKLLDANSIHRSELLIGIKKWCVKYCLLHLPEGLFAGIALVFFTLLFFKPVRNLVWTLLKRFVSVFKAMPGPEFKKLAQRYINLGRFAFYKDQSEVFERLSHQYPKGTQFILLPMDMAYMGAGRTKKTYRDQMAELAKLKENHQHTAFPFVFADPRRMAEEADYFRYQAVNNTVALEDCFIKTYIEDYDFSGFKIYPALGYYPFDEQLLPLWLYAADNCLPIMTHCIRGTIFYRGRKKKEWDYHPVLTDAQGQPLFLSEMKNKDFINNFTHPLNFLCLLEETLLRKIVGRSKDAKLKDLFGYTDGETELKRNLSHLKICFGHYGGDDEWNRFMERDRDSISYQLLRYPDHGIYFLTNANGNTKPGKVSQMWYYADWYSITSSLMLQYPNVYSDLSYIIHNPDIAPLLKSTLRNNKLKYKVLFGTDFYVVRNHKSEKSMLAEITGMLSNADLELIAKTNPRSYLGRS